MTFQLYSILFISVFISYSTINTLLFALFYTLQTFLSNLCEVSDFHEQLQLEEYIAVSRKDIAIEISPSEIATLQNLLFKYKAEVVSLLL